MTASFVQTLPDLADYRRELVQAGAPATLPLVPFRPAGLLAELPAPPPGRRGWPWTVETAPPPANARDWPLISIVTPSFQQVDTLEETIRSVLLQNYPYLEFVVMDGGSTDGSPAIIERYRPWLSFARVARDRGQSHAINLGFSLASATGFRAWLNSDDFHLPGAYRRLAEAHRRSHAEFIYGDQLVLHQEEGVLEIEALKPAFDRYVKFAAIVASHAAFWTADRHQPIWEEQLCAIDYELWIRLLPGTRKCHVHYPLGLVRHHAAAKTFLPAMRRKWEEDGARNALAHPNLYRPRPWLDLEYRLVNSFLRRWCAGRLQRTLAAVRQECAWPASGPATFPRT